MAPPSGSNGSAAVTAPHAAAVQWFPGYARPIRRPDPRSALFPVQVKTPGTAAIHVLMVEDDPSIAEMYRFQLEHDGHRVTVATTGEIAFSKLSGGEPDVVLLDLLLPDRSGFEVLATLNEQFPNHPPVVILSNYGEPSMMDRGRALGAVEYLVKSRVTPAEISTQIPGWAALGRRRRGRES